MRRLSARIGWRIGILDFARKLITRIRLSSNPSEFIRGERVS